MNLTSPSQVKAWCIDHGFHPNKVLGQNFLVDRNALEAIVDAAALPTGARVLEIGPGLGVLTEEMLRRGFTEEQVNEIKDIYEIIYFSGRNTTQALEYIEATFPATEIRSTIVDFIRASQRGIIPKPRENRR